MQALVVQDWSYRHHDSLRMAVVLCLAPVFVFLFSVHDNSSPSSSGGASMPRATKRPVGGAGSGKDRSRGALGGRISQERVAGQGGSVVQEHVKQVTAPQRQADNVRAGCHRCGGKRDSLREHRCRSERFVDVPGPLDNMPPSEHTDEASWPVAQERTITSQTKDDNVGCEAPQVRM